MFVIIGYIVVVGSVIGGYAMAGGHIGALFQPLELLMIGGAAFGAFIVANPGKDLKAAMGAIPAAFKGSKYTKERYLSVMAMLYDILTKARKEGLMAIENDVEQPESSPLFTRYPELLADHHLIEFVTDYLRMMISGNLNALEIENLMDNEMETHHHEAMVPSHSIQKMADGLPAFGIVAAVMGVVHTMGSVGQLWPPVIHPVGWAWQNQSGHRQQWERQDLSAEGHLCKPSDAGGVPAGQRAAHGAGDSCRQAVLDIPGGKDRGSGHPGLSRASEKPRQHRWS